MKSYLEALILIQSQAQPLASVQTPLVDALGAVAAEDLRSKESVPQFANSAMDGFAVRASETITASEAAPLRLAIAGLSAAGDAPNTAEKPAQSAWRIMTGAPIPCGYDAVVPVENVRVENDGVTLIEPAVQGTHVRRAGEDFAPGQVVLRAGEKITPAHITVLATTGHKTVAVHRRPRVLFFSTGNELVSDADQVLAPGEIRNGNGPYLRAVLTQVGVEAIDGGAVRDDAAAFETRLRAELQQAPDVILTTGAVSAGDFDFVPHVVKALGGEILFHKTAIKPGKPILVARLPNGSWFFGLPGNPVSTAVGFRFFVLPLLAALQGQPAPAPLRAALSGALSKPRADFRHFLKAQVFVDGDGLLRVRAHSGQESHKLAPLLISNAWLILEEGHTQFREGQFVPVADLFGQGFSFV